MIDRLLPADHAVGEILDDQHDEIEFQPHRGLELLAVHHEAAVAADCHHAALRVEKLGRDCGRQPRPHGGERVVEQQGVGDMGAVVAREPDLVHAIVEADDAVLRHDGADVMHEALRDHRKPVVLGPLVDMRRGFAFAALHMAGSDASLPSSRSASARTLAPMSPISSASG